MVDMQIRLIEREYEDFYPSCNVQKIDPNIIFMFPSRLFASHRPTCPCLMLTTPMTWRNSEQDPSPCQLARRRWGEVEDVLPADMLHPLPWDVLLIQTFKDFLTMCYKANLTELFLLVLWRILLLLVWICWPFTNVQFVDNLLMFLLTNDVHMFLIQCIIKTITHGKSVVFPTWNIHRTKKVKNGSTC